MKFFQLIFILFILFSCSTHSMLEYNTPFVNSTETTKLDFDLTKEEVLEILGEPLLVKRGTGSTRTIIWVYEVRTIEVEGEQVEVNFSTKTASLEQEYQPKKYNKNQKHNSPHHRLELEFIDGKLMNWYPEGKHPEGKNDQNNKNYIRY